MSRGRDPVEALKTEKHRRDSSSTSSISNFTRTFSKSIGIRRRPSQQDNTTARMPPKQRAKPSLSTLGDEGPPQTNGHSGNSTNRQSSNSPSVAQPEANLGPLAQELRDASKQLSNIQDAIRVITASCIQHADDITQIPEVRERYDNLSKEVEKKDATIAEQNITIDVLGRRASEKEEIDKKKVQANVAEKERLEQKKEELDQERRNAVAEQRDKEAKLKAEAARTLSRLMAEQDEELKAKMEAIDNDQGKRKKDQEEKLGNLEEKIKKGLKTINEMKARNGELRFQLKTEAGKLEDVEKLKEGYKQDKEELIDKLKGLQKEFSLNSEPLEYYQGEFLNISRAIQSISSQYLARELSNKEMAKLPEVIPTSDLIFSNVPFSNSETSKQLRIAHAQRVISEAVYNTVWQPFSSDVTAADSRLSKFLQEIGVAVANSRHESNGSGRSADVWRSVTIRTLESMSAADAQLQGSLLQGSGPVGTINSREDKLVELVLSVLGPLLDTSVLVQFKDDLLQIAKQAISVWTTAQADERTFTINPTLNQDNKSDWKVAALDYASLYASGISQGVVGSRPRHTTRVFTLFPIVTATKRVQVQKVDHGPPGSWPYQDQTEVTIIHDGLGLPHESEMVQRGIEEKEEWKKMKLEHEALWDKKLVEVQKGHSRNNSTTDTVSGPPSPSASWNKNRLNNHKGDSLEE